MPTPPPASELLECATRALRTINRRILDRVRQAPERMLKRLIEPDKDPSNQPLFVDQWAETQIEEVLQNRFGSRITLIGEESFQIYPQLKDLRSHDRVVALVDIIDGTDLLLRGLSNWCSAVVFFYPPERRVLTAAVGDHFRNVFFASETDTRAYFHVSD